MVLSRTDKGKLAINHLEMEIFLGELFKNCKTEKETLWLYENLQQTLELVSDERLEEIECEGDNQ